MQLMFYTRHVCDHYTRSQFNNNIIIRYTASDVSAPFVAFTHTRQRLRPNQISVSVLPTRDHRIKLL